jgi:hypothetical protein
MRTHVRRFPVKFLFGHQPEFTPFRVEYLHGPMSANMLMAATRQRSYSFDQRCARPSIEGCLSAACTA